MEAQDEEIELTGNSKKDFAWKYAKVDPEKKNFRCAYCNILCTGTINRLKHHLAGTRKNMRPCSKVPEDVKKQCNASLLKIMSTKKLQIDILNDIRDAAVGNTSGGSSVTYVQTQQVKPRGPMDKFAISEARQSVLNTKWKKEERKEVCKLVGRFFFSSGLPFNVINDPYFVPMCEGIGNYGPGFVPPSMHELKTWILKNEVDNINKILDEHKKSWTQYGCSIMSDSWTDGKNRCLINFLVNSPAGTWFSKSVDASDSIKNGELLFGYLDSIIDEVGEQNVVQVITDNGSNFVNAGKRLMEKRKHLYWLPCAAHCIDLMLEDIGKLKIHEATLMKAKQVVKFIYGHSLVLSMMRSFTNDHELLRPAVTRFSTAYLTLQSIYRQKRALISMFTSETFASTSWMKHPEGMKARATILHDARFWPQLAYCIRSVVPLVDVLREVDSEERPAMGFVYDLLKKAKDQIALNCGSNRQKFNPIWNKIDARWLPQLHQPLHAAGYYLNPQLRFEDDFANDDIIKDGLYACMERMIDRHIDRLKADVQLDDYSLCRGEFGSSMAIESRKLRAPGNYCYQI